MNDENALKLTSSFSKLYPQFHPLRPMRETPFFFEYGDGWFNLLWDLSQKLETEIILLEKNNILNNKQELPEAVQVKQKLGTLRFYMTTYTDTTRAAIIEAENVSSITCEVCGNLSMRRSGDWIMTLCDEHRALLARSR